MAGILLYALMGRESTPLAQRGEGRYVQILACHIAERMPFGDRGVGNQPHVLDNEQDGVVVAMFQRSFFVACMHCTFSCSLT